MAHRSHFYIDAYGLAADAPPSLQQYKLAVVAAAVVHPMDMAATEAAEALGEAGFSSTLRSVDDATGASNNIVRQKREERKR
ncbi:MAG: hypothetical protein FRX49_00585 [Trebouxia sp. A1-2]|nr:MAG: hypothetical protein FRX49_00585 [Trebouxia sp. A1-2]